MKRTTLIGLAATAALVALLAACGGSDDDEATPEIRTHSGLSVAAVTNQMGRTSATEESTVAPAAESAAGDTNLVGSMPATIGIDRSTLNAPALQQSSDGITILGYGSASADADSAVVEFFFGRGGGVTPIPEPFPGEPDTSSSSSGSGRAESREIAAQESEPITEADLQPVIDALVGAGVPRENIELLDPGYYDPYFARATLRATINDIGAVDGAVTAAQNAAAGLGDIQLQSTNVSYTLQDCAALERAATEAAVDDARARGEMTAEVLGVGLGGVTGASNYSYAPYGGTPCGSSIYGPYPLGGVAYAQGGSRTVEVFAQISVTYAIQ